MKPNEWLALVDIFDLFQLNRYCTEEELKNLEKMLEQEIMTQLVERYSPELPNELQTLDVIADVKKEFILEYLSEAEEDSETEVGIADKVDALLNSDDATPEQLEALLNEFYKSDLAYE